ncbi:hypothetical protein [Acidovorax sp. NCPPB 3576]|uniref:hypothetical protein n=1 Tax=Acidovorax sp. NCPPB 3576 TaxID=2940488 RepID=UPI00234B79DD|nr:hypothetical protein [Acidovorax sp. NCPPB 3576]WCM90618.1 hypothetical protein M5C98_11630 [Acidovorax sp. NCPPB 3576]
MEPRYTYKTLSSEWRDCEHWPAADVTFRNDTVKDRFERMARGMRLYLQTGALRAAAEEAGCSATVLLDALNRCVQVADGRIVGWLGLVKGVRLREYTRTKPTSGRHPRGKSGSFEQFLQDNQKLREKLHALIRAGGGEGSAKSSSPTQRGVARRFRGYCFTQGMTDDDYPFNTKSRGRRSIERYVKAFIATDPNASKVWHGADTSENRNLGTGRKSFSFAAAPFDIVAMDTHTLHCVGTLIVDGPAGPQEVAIERMDLHVLLDMHTICVLGYAVSIASQINALAIEDALLCLVTPWIPRELTSKGLSYIPGAALPVGNIPGLDEIRPGGFQFDNASQHFATRFIQAARMQLGCVLNFIPVGAWWRNAPVERLFRTLEQWGFQKLPSSTGSNPADPLKPNSVQAALKHHITWEHLVDLVDVILASYNATKHSALGGQTPLQALAAYLNSSKTPLVLRPSIPSTAHTPRLGVTVERRHVRGSVEKGAVRTPYIEIDKQRYCGPDLARRFDLIGTALVVHINERDMRTVTAFNPSGESMGELALLNRRWAQTKHSRALRKTINEHIRNGDFAPDGSDVVLSFLAFLGRRARQQMKARPNHVSGVATKLVEASRQTGVPIDAICKATDPGLPPVPHRPLPSHLTPPNWRNT